MKKTIIFNSEITVESVKDLIDQVQAIFEGCSIDLYFSSDGGSIAAQEVLSRFLNAFTSRLTLIGFNGLYSSGFDIFHNFRGKRELVTSCTGMVHQADHTISSRDLKDEYSYHTLLEENLDYLNDLCYEQYKPFLTIAERKRFQKGEDIYFTNIRLKQIFQL